MTHRTRVMVVVTGVVQGVGFRWFVERAATALSLDGWVANRPDGSVEVVAEGDAAAVEALLAAVREGPDGAWVQDVRVRHDPPAGIRSGFVIRPGSHPGD